MFSYVQDQMVADTAVNNLADHSKPTTKQIKSAIRQFRSTLARSQYQFKSEEVSSEQVAVTPLVGIGKRRNRLNQGINQLIAQAKDEIFICTPYFNFPPSLAKEVKKALKRGVKVSIVVGDKTANDFFISPEEEFKTIGGLPYLYELNLRRLPKRMRQTSQVVNCLSTFGNTTQTAFHLNGIWVDKRYMLLTGNNLNPRAWKLDLENGIFIQDNYNHLADKFQAEVDNILQHTQLICTYKQLDKVDSYPTEVQKLIRKITRVKADRVLKQIL